MGGSNTSSNKPLLNGNTHPESPSKEPPKELAPTPKKKESSSDWSEAIAALGDVEAAIKKAFKFSPVFPGIENALDQKSALELVVAEKNSRISFLEAFQTENLERHERRVTEWASEKQKLEEDVGKAKADATADAGRMLREQELKHKRDIDKLKKALTAEKNKSASLEASLSVLNDDKITVQKELEFAQTLLKVWDSKLSMLKELDLEKFGPKFQDQVKSYMDVMRNHFQRSLPTRLLADHSRWEKLARTLNPLLKLPASNTPAAQNARLIAALSAISPLFSDFIFAPCRIPTSASASRHIKELLRQQLRLDKRRENMMRALLLSSYKGEEVRDADGWVIEYVLQEALRLLGSLLEDPEEFKRDLEPELYGFVELWRAALINKELIITSNQDNDSTWEWDDMPELDADGFLDPLTPTLPLGKPKFETINLFPRVFIPETDQTIYLGLLVWSDQNSIIASETEYQAEFISRQTGGLPAANGANASPKRQRRPSNALEGGNGSAPSSPLAPRTPGSNGETFSGGVGGSDANGSHGSGVS